MTAFPKKIVWLLAVQVSLTSLLILSLLQWDEAKLAYEDSYRNRLACVELSEEIRSLRNLSTVAEESDIDLDMGNSPLVKLARANGITENQISSIQRYEPEVVEGSDYQREDVSIQVREASMAQLLRFAEQAEASNESTRVTSFALTHARTRRDRGGVDKTPEMWNAQLILTRLTFIARSARSVR